MKIVIYIAIMALVTNAIRIVPLLLIRKPITNRFICSFLHYVPYVTLAVMTCPAIIEDVTYPLAGGIALVIGIISAWLGGNLFQVALACSSVVLVVEYLLRVF